MIILAAVAAIAVFSAPAFAGSSPWLPPPGGGSITVSYVSQGATEFYRSTVKGPTPGGGANLSQQTVWVDGVYGLSDSVALDFRVGEARSSFITGEGLPPSQQSINGLQDINVGVVWRAVDEVVSSGPSIAFRVAGIKAGNYDTGYINSLGDGGNGLELSAMAGKFIADRFAVSSEIGYRYRDSSAHEIPVQLLRQVFGRRTGRRRSRGEPQLRDRQFTLRSGDWRPAVFAEPFSRTPGRHPSAWPYHELQRVGPGEHLDFLFQGPSRKEYGGVQRL